ncbi:MAG: DNA repair exonuclease [Dehalococcoidia bacterium]
MPPYRFVHAADLHLDSPFTGMLTVAPDIARALHQATFSAFDAIIKLTIEERADALLIAGDVFDSVDRSLKAQLAFERGLRELGEAGIRAFVCHGNHDPLDSWHAQITMPPNVHRFGPEVDSAPLRPDDPDSPVVYGVSYPRREVRENLVPRFKPHVDTGRPGIGLLHANVGASTGHENYAPCTLGDLAATGIGYWALGHIHTRRTDVHQGVLAAYPGNPQGRNPNETGPRGVLLVDVSESGEFSPTFRAVDIVRWDHLELSIDDLADQHGLEAAIQHRLEQARTRAEGRHLVYRITLAGRGELHHLVSQAEFPATLAGVLNETGITRDPFAYCERVQIATRSPVDRAGLLEAGGFMGDLLRMVEELPARPDATTRLQEDLGVLLESQRVRGYLEDAALTAEQIARMLPAAEARILNLLEGNDGE